MSLSGCGTIQPVVLPPTEIPRGKPIEAMEHCKPLPTLAQITVTLPAEDALRAVLQNKVLADQIYRDCAARHESLRLWILDE